ncbi:MAG: hypothetical protein HZB19_10025 [Chloroflexi bacterium]|nr:hypothetical protein [Chloroflexota bacterium]
MTKYTSVQKREQPVKTRQVHPVWRGIGCLFTILIPIISFAASMLIVEYGVENKWLIPYQLLGNPQLPTFIYKSAVLVQIVGPIAGWTNFYAILVIAIFLMIALGGLLAIVNAIVYQVAGPPRWGPQDVPPPKIKAKRYKR